MIVVTKLIQVEYAYIALEYKLHVSVGVQSLIK